MIIYNPDNMIPERIRMADEILRGLPYRHCFITGSFLFKKTYKDIDIFAVTRSRKDAEIPKKAKVTIIDFNDMHSLFYHSASKACVAKDILPKRALRATTADYWSIINESVPDLLNEKKAPHKIARQVVLYTEYLGRKKILDSAELADLISGFKSSLQIIEYIRRTAPLAIKQNREKNYIKRYFYTQAGYHRKNSGFPGQMFLYDLARSIARAA